MDEALILCAVDLGGRPYLIFDADFRSPCLRRYGYTDGPGILYAVSYSARMNIHIKELYGSNDHHVMEAIFLGFCLSPLRTACEKDLRMTGILSTKGVLKDT